MTAEVEQNVNPNDITFDIPIEDVKPMAGSKVVGRVLGYCTQEYFGEGE